MTLISERCFHQPPSKSHRLLLKNLKTSKKLDRKNRFYFMSSQKPVTHPSFDNIEKIDAHMHLNASRSCLQEVALQHNFELVSINTEADEFPDIQRQQQIVQECRKQQPNLYHLTTFSTDNLWAEEWSKQAIAQIKVGLGKGAVGVKIWKNVGMELQDEEGRFVMVDDEVFTPLMHFLEEHQIPLLGHLGEPKNCWLPIDEMTVTSDKEYFSGHSQYHMYLHREYPSYQQQLKARDAMLAKHPDLIFVGAHLASIEWSVDELAEWLDTFPNTVVDLAERVCHLQHQAAEDHKKVKEFVEAYQDRIIYGSDQIDDGSKKPEEIKNELLTKWKQEYDFFANDNLQKAWNVQQPFYGLGLREEILKKIFCSNARRVYSL